jgi:teichuronic acid biosynthesis glycosyltransferase TuaC
MRVAIVAEDRAGVHRLALAAADAGADVRVLVPRGGRWAAPRLALALRRLQRRWPYDLVHAHHAGDLAHAARGDRPLVLSCSAAEGSAAPAVLAAARLVLADSHATAERCLALGARAARVVHPGTDLPEAPAAHDGPPRLVTVADLLPRTRLADVLRALWLLREAQPELTWDVYGEGPEREGLQRLASELGLAERVTLRGRVPPERGGTVFVLPSVEEPGREAYLEAMGAGVPAVGCRGEDGPEEIAAAGGGIRLVPPADPEALAAELEAILGERRWRHELGVAARRTVGEHFTWPACGRATVAAYEAALA